ncbi:MAG: hypothetical protein GX051_04810 [Clostridiales bacterium]|jgi:predicted transcriptional regulator|nr:hypothetical protein [Clostridiales bacterium]
MKVNDIVTKLSLEVLCGDTSREAGGCYIGDLLSWVMSHAKCDDVWITIMSNSNVVAVASLVDAACVIIAEGVKPDPEIIALAQSKDICLLGSEKTAFELAALMPEL